MPEESRVKSKKGPIGWRIVFVVALIVFIVSVAALGVIGFSYLQGQMKYSEVAQNADFEPAELETGENLGEVTVDWDALKAVNGDTVAWIYVPNSNINYPIVQAQDNDYYLYHDFDGDAGWLANYGAVFMDFRNNPKWTDHGYFFYGHHMNDGSMFADLAGMTNQGRFDECRTIFLLTPNGNFRLRTFAMVHIQADDTVVQPLFASAEEMTAYVQDKIDKSVVDPGPIAQASDIKKFFTLATCDNIAEDGRYLLYAYIEDTNATGLEGNLGLASDGESTVGFDEQFVVN